MTKIILKIVNRVSVLWSLKLAFEVFHDFFAYGFGGGTPDPAGRHSRKSAVAVGKEFGMAEGNFITKNARPGLKEVMSGI